MRVRQHRVSARRSLLCLAVAAVALLSAVPAVSADEHKQEGEERKQGGGNQDQQQEPEGGRGSSGVKIEGGVKTNGGHPDTVVIDYRDGDKAKGEPDTLQVTFRECKAVAGRDGQADLAPVLASLKGCPTGLVTLLSPAEGGPAAYTWSEPSVAADIPNLLIYGSNSPSKGKGKKGENDDPSKKLKDLPIPPPAAIIELSGSGPLRTGPWAARDVAFTPSSTAPLEGVPFQISRGDASLSNVMFSGFENPVFKISDDYTLNILGGLFTDNKAADATVDVAGGTFHCHRCHFTENEGTAIKATGADSLVGLSFSKFLNNTATDGLIRATNSRGGFASTSFIDNTIASPDAAVLALTDGSLFLGRNALFRNNVGGDLLANDSHFRIDKSLFKGSALNEYLAAPAPPPPQGIAEGEPNPAAPVDGGDIEVTEPDAPVDKDIEIEEPAAPVDDGDIEEPAAPVVDGDIEEPAAPVVDGEIEMEESDAPVDGDSEVTPTGRRLQDQQEGSVVRLLGASSLRGFNNFFDGTQGPAILAQGASNITLGRPCFTNDAAGTGTGEARFVEAAALDGNLTMWGACAFPASDNATALYGTADVVIDGMEPESVALTPFSPLAIGGEASGIMPPQNGSCVKSCTAGFQPPEDWDPAARPPPGPPKNVEDMIKFDEKTGTVSIIYPADYKGPQLPSFQLPPGLGISFSSSHPSSNGNGKTRSLLRGSTKGASSFLDLIVKRAMRAVHRRAPFSMLPFPIPEDIQKHLGISDENVSIPSPPPVPTTPTTTPPVSAPTGKEEDGDHEHHEHTHDDDIAKLLSLFGGGGQPPLPEDVVALVAPVVVISTDDTPVEPVPEPPKADEKDEKDGEKDKGPSGGDQAQQLQNDLSAPWDNNRDADKWNKPDWSFLANFPSIPNSAAAGKGGSSEKEKDAVKAARAYEAYMAFLENNPGVALPSSAAPAPVSPDTAPTTSPDDANATEPTDTPTPPEEATASQPQPESDSATPTDPAAAPEAPAEPTTTTIPETDAPAAAPACPEGETPLILYLDSGSTGEYESCAAATNGTAAYYFVARAGESEARTFALPEESEASSFALMQILDLGCQPPSTMLEVELYNELVPNVTCARWLVPNWAEQLAGQGKTVTIDDTTGAVTDVQDNSAVMEVPAPEPEPTTPVLSSETEFAAAVEPESVAEGPVRRAQRHRRRLQEAPSVTTYDITEPAFIRTNTTMNTVAGPVAVAEPAASSADASTTTTTTTVVAVPIELGESPGGSMLKIICITDSESLSETHQIEFNLPGFKATVIVPGAPSSASAPASTAEPLPAGGEAVSTQADQGPALQQKKSSGGNAGAAAGGVIGALVGLAAVAALVVVIRKRRQANLNDALSRMEDF